MNDSLARNDSLAGRVVLITGAARGIGEATARLAATRGAHVVCLGLEPDRLSTLAAEIDGCWLEVDVTDQAQLRQGVQAAVTRFGGIDAVVANAGVASRGTIAVGDIEAHARTIEVNLIGVMRTVAASVDEATKRRGYFLLVSSAAAFTALPGMAPYCAAKAGVEHFGNALRLELAHKGVAVGTAHPSWVDTDLVRDAKDDLSSFKETLARLPAPFGSVTSVESCAQALVSAIEHRARRIYIPKSVGLIQRLRTLANGRLAQRLLTRDAATSIPRLESEVRRLNRPFGAHTIDH
jgi:NAD(P)-dependent dehydrogenase (short-subunit alcohol dehydrogenase family)